MIEANVPLKVGLIGPGGSLEAALRAHSNVDVVAAGTAEHVLAQQAVEAVALGVPAVQRGEVAESAASAGVHVLAEAPLALTVAEVDRIGDKAGHTGAVVAVAQPLRNHPMVGPVVAGLRGGRVGLPWSIQADYVVGGADDLATLAAQPLDLVTLVLGESPNQVRVARASGSGYLIQLDYANGVTAAVLVGSVPDSAEHTPLVHRYRIAGSGGTLSTDLTRFGVQVTGGKTPGSVWVGGDASTQTIDNFVAAVRGTASVSCGIPHARAAAAVLAAAAASLDTGQPSPVDLPKENR